MHFLYCASVLSSLFPPLKNRTGKDFKDDLEFLLQGISEFDLRGDSILSDILVHGSLAFPIGTKDGGQVFLAGAYYGQGRVIVISHEGFLRREVEFTFTLFQNFSINHIQHIICSYEMFRTRLYGKITFSDQLMEVNIQKYILFKCR